MKWQLQEAKNKFSQLVQEAQRKGPQTVTVRGERTAIVLSAKDFDALQGGRRSLVDDLLGGPAWDDDLVTSVNERAKSPSRDPEF